MSNSDIKDTWLIIINPVAGGGKARKLWPKIHDALKELDIPFEPIFTKHKGEILAFTSQFLSQGFRKFVACGGDGTLHEVVNGIFSQQKVSPRDTIVTMIPLGMGVDWPRMYDYPPNPKAVVKLLKEGKTIFQDIGKVEYFLNSRPQVRYFNNIAGMGFDAAVVNETESNRKKGFLGQLSYLWALLKTIGSYRGQEMIVKGESFEVHSHNTSANIGICKFSGGGMRMVPKAIADDGLFDVTVIRYLNPFQIIRNLPKLYNGRIYTHKKISLHRAKEVYIHAEGGVLLEADGEMLGQSPATFSILPQAIQILVPKRYKSQSPVNP
ncbi:MAG: diacylglycerol kinase family protein [Bacteroidota bacterium]